MSKAEGDVPCLLHHRMIGTPSECAALARLGVLVPGVGNLLLQRVSEHVTSPGGLLVAALRRVLVGVSLPAVAIGSEV